MDELTFWGERVVSLGTAYQALRLSEPAMKKLLDDSGAETNVIDARMMFFRPRDLARFLNGRDDDQPLNDFWTAPIVTRERLADHLNLTQRQVDRIAAQAGIQVAAYGQRRFLRPAEFADALMAYRSNVSAVEGG